MILFSLAVEMTRGYLKFRTLRRRRLWNASMVFSVVLSMDHRCALNRKMDDM